MWIKSPRVKIVFDMDGVIMDSEKTWHLAMDQFLTDLGIQDSGMKIAKELTGKTENESAKIIKNAYSLPHSPQELAEKRLETVSNLHFKHSKPFDGAEKLLKELEEGHYSTALATSSSRDIAYQLIEANALRRYFDYITTADEVVNGKPHPEMYHLTADKLCVDPEDCLVFEDSLHGIKAAKDAGMKVVAIKNGGIFNDEEYKKENPIEIVDHINQIDLSDIKRWSRN